MKTILMVDDEEKIRDVVISYLQKDGFRTLESGTGADALQLVRSVPIDLVILDLMLPDTDGEEVCKSIRQFSSVPVLMLTAKVAKENRIHGLTIGADDYMIKPFDPRELIARVRAILRRTNEQQVLADRISFYGDELVIDSILGEVYSRGEIVTLTPSEYKLLLVLVRHPQRQFSREELVEKFEGDVRAIDQHVKNLRQKIESDPRQPKYIHTIYGKGYRFIGGI